MTNRNAYDTLAPEVRILIKGSPLPCEAEANLIEISVLDDIAAASMFSCTLLSWNQMTDSAQWLDEEPFREGNDVEVQMGYRDSLQTLFKGEITALEPEFVHGAPPRLTVRGYDRRHRLMQQRKTRSFQNMTDSDIANQIARDEGLSPEVHSTGVHLDYVLQHNRTDYEFLEHRARRIGYELVVADRTLYFRPKGEKQGEALVLSRDVELLDFYPRLTTAAQVKEVFVRGWNPKEKKEIVGHAQVGDEVSLMGGTVSGPALAGQVFKQTGSTSVDAPVYNREDADQVAKGWFNEIALSYITGTGVAIGEPRLRAGTVVKIEGVGRRFSGMYYVTSAEHTYQHASGYRTGFAVRRSAT